MTFSVPSPSRRPLLTFTDQKKGHSILRKTGDHPNFTKKRSRGEKAISEAKPGVCNCSARNSVFSAHVSEGTENTVIAWKREENSDYPVSP